MQRCPKCGYREKYDWPAILWIVGILYLVFISTGAPRGLRFTGLVAFLLFLVASVWNMIRNERNRRDYLKSEASLPSSPANG